MKKVIAVLMVLAIVVGMAFADDTHTITVNGKVGEVLPIFQLYMQLNGNMKTNTANGGAEYGTSPAVVDATGVNLGFTLDEEGSVVVKVQLINPAKTTKYFNLVFSNGIFAVERDEKPGTYAPTSIDVVKGSDNVGFEITNINDGVKVDFDGKTSGVTYTDEEGEHTGTVISAQAPYLLATATYNYPGDTTIDPNETEGYEANIVLTITGV